MQLPPLATNTTNTNWWIFPSLLEVVNIPPPPHPTRLALVPLLVEVIVCLLVLFACFFCLSICQYSFPLVLSLSPAKMYTLLHLTSILIQICGLERPATTTNKQKKKWIWPMKHYILWVRSSTENAGQTDRLFLWAPCFLPVQGIAFTLWVTTTCICSICT